uniref:Amyotrophic lateral sclerosis 2 chromosomal region candidate gene 11 protein n=1 Tax=Castor canadensis TaxID=51338 RepID=A0A8B7WEF3_CASCN|nr:amyotrophic lateral sclerosis 2 chromosomal region candidate gene 11 protein [Castor canadensis]
MLRQTLQESESEEVVVKQETPTLVPFGDVVCWLLAVHIKNCRQLIPKISSQHRNSLFFRISVNNIVKCTKTHSLKSTANEKNPVIKFNDVKYFSVQVPRRQEDERNKIFLELMQYDETGKFPTLIGSVEVHLYQIIQKGCFTEELQILHDNTFVCRVDVEFMFSYGNFGYGFSHQLKPLQKHIQPSMFMNIAPPPERTDPQTNVITPQPVEYPAFLSPDLNVTIGTRTDVKHPNQTPVVRLEKLQQQPRERLERMKKVYRNLNTWTEKADYLGSIINPKLGHKDSKEGNVTEVLENQSNNPYEEMSVKITLDEEAQDQAHEIVSQLEVTWSLTDRS